MFFRTACFRGKQPKFLAGGGVAFVAVIAAIVFAVKFIKKRKEAKQQKDDENEIS